MIYIYGLVCPIAGTVRYVGKSQDPKKRVRAHVLAAARGEYNHRTARWLRKLSRQGLAPILEILEEVAPGQRWQEVERAWIAAAPIRGWNLTNSTAGGEGLDYIDPVADAKYRANLSATMKELWNRPERRAQARARAAAFYADAEAATAKAEAVRLAYTRPEVLERARAINAEINSRPEVKAKKSASAKAAWEVPERRVETGFTSDVRRQMSESAKARWADPVRGAQARAGHSSPERRAKVADSARRRATPEYRAMMAAKTKASWETRRRKAQEG